MGCTGARSWRPGAQPADLRLRPRLPELPARCVVRPSASQHRPSTWGPSIVRDAKIVNSVRHGLGGLGVVGPGRAPHPVAGSAPSVRLRQLPAARWLFSRQRLQVDATVVYHDGSVMAHLPGVFCPWGTRGQTTRRTFDQTTPACSRETPAVSRNEVGQRGTGPGRRPLDTSRSLRPTPYLRPAHAGTSCATWTTATAGDQVGRGERCWMGPLARGGRTAVCGRVGGAERAVYASACAPGSQFRGAFCSGGRLLSPGRSTAVPAGA